MSLSDNNMVMPVAPTYGYGGGGFGGDFGSGIWLILIVLFALGGFGGFGFGGGGFADGAALYPWMNQTQATQAGFNQATTNSQLSGIQNSITTGFGNAEVANCNRAMDAMQTAYNNQIASMNQNFANQQALDTRFYDMQSQLASCCCENRLANANLNATILSENCADRAALSNGVRDIITNQTAGIQKILDTICQDKIDAKNEKIADLERQLSMATLAASQTAQTAYLVADNTAQTQYIVNRVAPYPIPSYTVPNPFTPAATTA